jgi:metal-dependent amidase/aminoacylase/carboxypeptidase family protein
MWAEDMALMHERRPGADFIVGARGRHETSYPYHNTRFDIDERALDVGYRMMVGLGLRLHFSFFPLGIGDRDVCFSTFAR